MDWTPVKIDLKDLVFLKIADHVVDTVVNEFRVPAEDLRGESGPSPLGPVREGVGLGLAAERYLSGVLRGRIDWDGPVRRRGPNDTPPVSRKFFPPGWKPSSAK